MIEQPEIELTVLGRVASQCYYPVGVIEGQIERLPIATSLNEPNAQGKVLV